MLSLASVLIMQSLSDSTRKAYQRSWNHFRYVCNNLQLSPCPASVDTLLVYIAWCSSKNVAYSTVLTRLSAISFIHKFRKTHVSTNDFLIRKALRGYSKGHTKLDSRLPITLSLLHKMCSHLSSTLQSNYNITMFKCMFLLAFHGFLRVGEFTLSSNNVKNILQLKNIKLEYVNRRLTGMLVEFTNFKHSNGKHYTLHILKQKGAFCPVKSMYNYFSKRSHTPGQLFVLQDTKPVKSSYFNNVLKTVIKSVQGSSDRYSAHCFRIGAATLCLQKGYSKEIISKMGRWHSNAVDNYLRISSFSV